MKETVGTQTHVPGWELVWASYFGSVSVEQAQAFLDLITWRLGSRVHLGRTWRSSQSLGQSTLTERTRLAKEAEKVEEERLPVRRSWQPDADVG